MGGVFVAKLRSDVEVIMDRMNSIKRGSFVTSCLRSTM